MTTATDLLADPELLETEWDLAPLVDGEDRAGAERMLQEGRDRAATFAASYAGKVAELDAEGLRAAMHELEEINELIGRAGSVRQPAVLDRHGRPRARRAAAARPGARHRDRDPAPVLRARVGRLDDDRADELLASASPRSLPPPPATARGATARTCSRSPRRRSSPRSRSRARRPGAACSASWSRRSGSTSTTRS